MRKKGKRISLAIFALLLVAAMFAGNTRGEKDINKERHSPLTNGDSKLNEINESNEGKGADKMDETSVYDQYSLIWQDEFNGAELNMEDWNYEFHEPGWVNNELQSYSDSPENIFVKDGKLVIKAKKIEEGEKTFYTSGRINTKGKHDFKYGLFEARAKVPNGKGFLPAFWMMPADERIYGPWPKCGEIDIMEVVGSQTDKVYGTLHFGEPHKQIQGSYILGIDDFSEEYHLYSCEWEPGKLRFYVDNELYFTANDWDSNKEGHSQMAYPAPFDQPFYIILNLAVGGDWPGKPNETTKFEENAELKVDYVRVYQKKSYDEKITN